MTIWKQFLKAPFAVLFIWLLCILGATINVGLLIRDALQETRLLPLHLAFLLLYTGQIIFILWRARYVFILTVLQGFAALWTAADFIFTPVLQLLGLVYWTTDPTVESQAAYQYIFMSAAFTLQMASAAYLWAYFSGTRKK